MEAFALFGWSAAAAHTGSHTSGHVEDVRQLPISERRRGASDVEREAKPTTARSAAAPAIASGQWRLRTRVLEGKEEPPRLCSITQTGRQFVTDARSGAQLFAPAADKIASEPASSLSNASTLARLVARSRER